MDSSSDNESSNSTAIISSIISCILIIIVIYFVYVKYFKTPPDTSFGNVIKVMLLQDISNTNLSTMSTEAAAAAAISVSSGASISSSSSSDTVITSSSENSITGISTFPTSIPTQIPTIVMPTPKPTIPSISVTTPKELYKLPAGSPGCPTVVPDNCAIQSDDISAPSYYSIYGADILKATQTGKCNLLGQQCETSCATTNGWITGAFSPGRNNQNTMNKLPPVNVKSTYTCIPDPIDPTHAGVWQFDPIMQSSYVGSVASPGYPCMSSEIGQQKPDYLNQTNTVKCGDDLKWVTNLPLCGQYCDTNPVACLNLINQQGTPCNANYPTCWFTVNMQSFNTITPTKMKYYCQNGYTRADPL